MGKYRASLIHEWWSDWHYKNMEIKRTAYMADVDDTATSRGNIRRSWAELRKGKGIVVILELKWKWAIDFDIDLVTVSEQILMRFYENNSKPFYVIAIDPLKIKPEFYIYRPYKSLELITKLSEQEMIGWINGDYSPDFLESLRIKQTLEASQ